MGIYLKMTSWGVTLETAIVAKGLICMESFVIEPDKIPKYLPMWYVSQRISIIHEYVPQLFWL